LEKLELSLIENIQRQDLNPIEKAEAYGKMIEEFSLTHEEAAQELRGIPLGKPRCGRNDRARLQEAAHF